MYSYIEILFKGERKDIYHNPMQFPFKVGDYAVVEADKGEDLGVIHQLGAMVDRKKGDGERKKILRKPTSDELKKYEENKKKESDAFYVCREKIANHNLDMKLVDVEYQYDCKKITFYFTSDQRVDFRELVKDLASKYKVRIELRQIGVRDESKRLGGYGICGCKICCTTFLKEFEPITTQCAKEQNLPLNPQKLSGLCGRLRCCLKFEHEFYKKQTKKFPHVCSQVKSAKGVGIISQVDVFNERVVLTYESGEVEYLDENEAKELEILKNNGDS